MEIINIALYIRPVFVGHVPVVVDFLLCLLAESVLDLFDFRRIPRNTVYVFTDITYVRLKGGYVYLTAIIDWYSRFVLAWR